MASVTKHGRQWRAHVARKGRRLSKVFPTKREAQDWAARQEYLIGQEGGGGAKVPLSDVLDRYEREVSTAKKGYRWEALRLRRFAADLGKTALRDLSPADLAAWRDKRLREVSPGTVRREMVLLGHVLSVARREWGYIAQNPMRDVRRPAEPQARDRLPTAAEMERLAHVAGDDLTTRTARAFHAFLFACETAMRAGEIVGLTWDRVDLDRRVARLAETKNGRARDVPLSSEAIRLLEALPRLDPVFGLTTGQIDALWRKIRDKAGVEGLTFHDSRHAAITMLSTRLDVLALARMVGHRDIRQLQTYYSETAEDLAKRLG